MSRNVRMFLIGFTSSLVVSNLVIFVLGWGFR